MRRAFVLVAFLLLAAPAQSRLDPLCLSACPGDRNPAWSPDGRSIAFVDYGGPKHQGSAAIGLIGADGSGLEHLPSPSGLPQHVLWSPDSSLLAFVTYLDVEIIRVDGSGLVGRSITSVQSPPAHDAFPAWSPDSRIAFVRMGFGPTRFGPGDAWCCELRVMQPDGGGQVSVGGARGSGTWFTHPAFGPDGRLAYLSGRTDANNLPLPAAELVASDGRNLVTLYKGEGLGAVQWSSDGKRVAVVQVDGGSTKVVVAGFGGTVTSYFAGLLAELSPDFSHLAFVRPAADGPRLVVATLEPFRERVVAKGSPPEARGLLQFAWSPDSKRLAYVSDGECPTVFAVHVVGVDGTGRRRLDHPCRIQGTARNDRLVGTEDPDGIYGLGGNDAILGRYGPDFAQGGAGDDRIFGGPGKDRLYGGPGRDLVSGEGGDDRIDVRDGSRDRVFCGPGDESVTADRLDVVASDCERVERR